MAYVYFHRSEDTNELFYIGIGSQAKHARAYFTHNRSLHWKRHVAKHGLVVEIFSDNIDWEEAKRIEIEQIAKFGRLDKGTGVLINKTDGGDGILGVVFSQETLALKSSKLKGKKMSEEHRRKLSLAKLGKKRGPHSEETKRKMSEASMGRPKSEEAKRSLSIAKKGQKFSEQARINMGLASKGRMKSPETREKLRLANLGKPGRPKTEAQKQYMREKMTGRVYSEETIEKMRKAAQNRKKTA